MRGGRSHGLEDPFISVVDGRQQHPAAGISASLRERCRAMSDASSEPATIRPANVADVPLIRACVRSAYAKYRDRVDRELMPVLADYDALVAREVVWVLAVHQQVHGIIVLYPQSDALFIENVAVHPDMQGRGYGKHLLLFAEAQARKQALDALSLYTNEVMTENLRLYERFGYVETDRRIEDGYRRVYLTKRL
jgi:ribosomal protein S18 acetylase RimI-like enzyme